MAALVLAPEADTQTVPWQVPSLIPEVGQPLTSWGSWGGKKQEILSISGPRPLSLLT